MTSEIEWRVQGIYRNRWAVILAYKNARVDMQRLDEMYGALGWQKRYEVRDGRLYCAVGVKNPDTGEWVWKEDVGTESNTEAEKGQASDAFKRACFNWGIGRELYSFPTILVQLTEDECYEQGGKFKQSKGLKLGQWKWKVEHGADNRPTFIGAKDQNGNTRFIWGTPKAKEKKK